MTRVAVTVVWLLLVLEALWLAPPPRPDQSAWLWALIVGDWDQMEPWVVALFQLMGAWPLAMAAVLATQMRRRPIPLWPFALACMGLGAFVLLPGIAIGGASRTSPGWVRVLRHPILLGILALITLTLVGVAAVVGDPAAYTHAFQTEQFVHVMTLDFVALWITSVIMAREEGGRWWLCAVPLLGALAWAATRSAR